MCFTGLVGGGGRRDDHFWKFLNMFAVCEKRNWEWDYVYTELLG